MVQLNDINIYVGPARPEPVKRELRCEMCNVQPATTQHIKPPMADKVLDLCAACKELVKRREAEQVRRMRLEGLY